MTVSDVTYLEWCGIRWPKNVGPELCPNCRDYIDVFEKDGERGFQHHLKSWSNRSVVTCGGKPQSAAGATA